jgi:hypothetical protein
LLLAHLSIWDTTKDADEFFRAYIERTSKRYPKATSREMQTKDERAFQTPEGEFYIQLRGQSVLVIEGLPGEKLLERVKLAETLWKK